MAVAQVSEILRRITIGKRLIARLVILERRYEELLGSGQEAQGAADLQADACAQIKQVFACC